MELSGSINMFALSKVRNKFELSNRLSLLLSESEQLTFDQIIQFK